MTQDTVLACVDIRVSLAAALGAVTIHYQPGAPLCGKCLLCLLLQQIPANGG